MKRINLTKYGFERSKEDDFSDDGNYFICYRHPQAPNIRVSKLVADGEVYLSSSLKEMELNYDEYKTAKNYQKATWDFNPANISNLTDDDLRSFTQAVIDFNDECKEILNKAYIPTREELEKKFDEYRSQAIDDKAKLSEIYNGILKNAIYNPTTKFDKYTCLFSAIRYFKEALNYAEDILKRNKKEYIDSLENDSRLRKIYYMNDEIKPYWTIKYIEEYAEKASKQ